MESCNVTDNLNDQCYSQFTSVKGNRSVDILDYLYNFNCSSPESYLIPDLPHDSENCIQADDICELIITVTHTCMLCIAHTVGTLPLQLTLNPLQLTLNHMTPLHILVSSRLLYALREFLYHISLNICIKGHHKHAHFVVSFSQQMLPSLSLSLLVSVL